MVGPSAHLIVCLILAGSVQAQVVQEPMLFNHLDRNDGLSHNTVFEVAQDYQGYMWFGTADGLNRYDGYNFTVFRHNPADTTSLSNNTVRRIYEDRNRMLWIRTGSALNRFDRQTESFIRYPVHAETLVEDPAGQLWAINQQGLIRYDSTRDRFDHIWAFPPKATTALVGGHKPWGVLIDRNGIFWIGTEEGDVYRYDPTDGTYDHRHIPTRNVMIRHQDENGMLWFSHEQGIGRYNPITSTHTLLAEVTETEAAMYLMVTSDSTYWLASRGLHRYNPKTGVTHRYLMEEGENGQLANTTWMLHKDAAGGIWIGTLNGVYRYDPYVTRFQIMDHDQENPRSLSSNIVMSVLEDADGILWAGTFGGGLNRLNTSLTEATRFRHNPNDSGSLCSDIIWDMYENADETLWLGTQSGLCALNKATGRFTSYSLVTENQPIEHPAIFQVASDREGFLWTGGPYGLQRLDPATLDVTSFTNLLGDLKDWLRIEALHLDSEGNLWIGTATYALYRLDPADGSMASFDLLKSDGNADSEGIWALYEDDEDVMWAGSDRGLYYIHPPSGTAYHYTTAHGLPGSVVYSIHKDALNRIWLSTNAGLAMMQHPFTDSTWTPDQGLPDIKVLQPAGITAFNRRAFEPGDDGRFFYGSESGLVHVHSEEVLANPHPPLVALTRIETTSPDSIRTLIPGYREELVLSPREYAVAFEFTGLHYSDPALNQYAYRMSGIDAEWHLSGTRRFAQYTNLRPGSYQFQVKASNNDGVWNDTGISLPIRVRPYFWQTWWFRTSIGSTFFILLIGFVRYLSTRQLRRQVRELEVQAQLQQERARISRDLHDNVGAQLSTIISGVELIRLSALSNDIDKLQTYLEEIDADSRYTLSQLRETIWTLHNDQIQVDELVKKLSEFADRRLKYSENIALEVAPLRCPTLRLSPKQALCLFRIGQEAINNAIKHANASQIVLTIEQNPHEWLAMSLQDNGHFVEPDPKRQTGGTGLNSMRLRAEEINAALDIQKEPGTTITVRFPL